MEVSYPSLAEQQRIVAIIDEAFAGIATAKANAEKNLQNARELFDSHLHRVFSRAEESWTKTALGSEVDLLAGFAFQSKRYTESEQDICLLRGDNIMQTTLRWEDVKRWPRDESEEFSRFRLEAGDVVLAMDRPWVKAGLKRAMIREEDLPCLLVQRTARLRVRAMLDNRFLAHLISSPDFITHILGVQTGIGVPHISASQISDFVFFRPPLAEQQRVANELDSLRAEIERLDRIYASKLAALEELKQSLLAQAFAGELI